MLVVKVGMIAGAAGLGGVRGPFGQLHQDSDRFRRLLRRYLGRRDCFALLPTQGLRDRLGDRLPALLGQPVRDSVDLVASNIELPRHAASSVRPFATVVAMTAPGN